MRFADKNLLQRGLKKTGSLGEKTWQSIDNSINIALTIIAPNVVLRELLSQAKIKLKKLSKL